MKKIKHVLLVVLGVICFIAAKQPTQEVWPKKLKFDKETIVFDTLKEGEKVNISFKFTVDAQDSVKIHQVYTGCSCTATDYPKDSMGAGSRQKLDVVFDSKNWGSDTGNYVQKHIYVLYNGGSQTIYFEGYVRK